MRGTTSRPNWVMITHPVGWTFTWVATAERVSVPRAEPTVPELPKTATVKSQKFVLRGRRAGIAAQEGPD